MKTFIEKYYDSHESNYEKLWNITDATDDGLVEQVKTQKIGFEL